MRRYARTLIFIAILVALAGVFLGIKRIDLGGLERGEDTVLGLSLGLDLQGGSHLVYQAVDSDTGEPISPGQDEMEALKRSIERRVNASGLGEPIIQLLGGDRLLIQLPGVRDPGRAKSIVGETAFLEFKHRRLNVRESLDALSDEAVVSVTVGTLTPEAGEPEAEVTPEEETQTEAASEGQPETEVASEGQPETEATPEEETQADALGPPYLIVEFTEEGAQEFTEVVDRLRESLGLDEDLLPIEGIDISTIRPNSISLSVEGTESRTFSLVFGLLRGPLAEQIGGDPRDLLGQPFIQRIGDSNSFALSLAGVATDLADARDIFGDGPNVLFNEEIQGKVDTPIDLTGDDLARAYASQHQQGGLPIVVVEFNSRGTRIFGELTSQIAGSTNDQVAIFLDEEELISPVVQTAITAGTATIQGRDFTLSRVRDISLLLESGRLPIPIELIQERDVDASLGADSLSKSVVAGSVGLALVLLFMALYYRFPGIVAALALLIYATLLLAILKMVPVTLTLSGVAAAILSVGMAVDANILIFERMKDELRAGRTLMSSINIGFNRAWPAIRDGNVSTLITCGILYYFSDQLGTTIVQGFAATLAIGVVVSMFTAIVVSRTFLRVVATTDMARRLRLFVPSGGAQLPQQRQQAAVPAAPRS